MKTMAMEAEDEALRRLLLRRLEDLSDPLNDFDLADILRIIVMAEGDTVEALEESIPHRLLTDWDNRQSSDTGFVPAWEVCEVHPSWFEITFILTDDGFGVVVYVPRDEGTDPVLLELCQRYGVPPLVATCENKKEVNE